MAIIHCFWFFTSPGPDELEFVIIGIQGILDSGIETKIFRGSLNKCLSFQEEAEVASEKTKPIKKESVEFESQVNCFNS